jgi:hypothetical protein
MVDVVGLVGIEFSRSMQDKNKQALFTFHLEASPRSL